MKKTLVLVILLVAAVLTLTACQLKAPVNLTFVYNPEATLASIQLPEKWSWKDPSIIPTCDVEYYAAYHTSSNGKVTETDIKIEVTPAASTLIAAPEVEAGPYTVGKPLPALMGGQASVFGSFEYTDSDAVTVNGENSCDWVFIPQTENYTRLSGTVNFTVNAPELQTSLHDGLYKTDKLSFEVYANDGGSKLPVSSLSVTLDGEALSPSWDDSEKTTYTATFPAEGDYRLELFAIGSTDNTYICYDLNYRDLPVEFTLSIEAFTIGCGYIIQPKTVTLDSEYISAMAQHFNLSPEDMKQNVNGAYVVAYELVLASYTLDYMGDLSSSFYLSAIKGFYHENKIPENLLDAIIENGIIPDDEPFDNYSLGEFDYTWMSGWMYTVHNSILNVGMADYYPQDGDVMRLQFTIFGYGGDISDGWMGTLFESVNRDNLTSLIAQVNMSGSDKNSAYNDAVALVQAFGITQQQLDDSAAALKAAYSELLA